MFEFVSETLLLSELGGDIGLLVGGFLKFTEDHVKSFHQTNFFTFELLELIAKTALGIRNITLVSKSCGGWLLTTW